MVMEREDRESIFNGGRLLTDLLGYGRQAEKAAPQSVSDPRFGAIISQRDNRTSRRTLCHNSTCIHNIDMHRMNTVNIQAQCG